MIQAPLRYSLEALSGKVPAGQAILKICQLPYTGEGIILNMIPNSTIE